MLNQAVLNRDAAIGRMVDSFLNERNGYTIADTPENRERFREALNALRPLGRTSRWNTAINFAIYNSKNDSFTLDWLIRQHSVYLHHASQPGTKR